MKVSVLVPVFNVQDFLPKCIDSILGQTYADFELILVDDGSTDESGRICDEYALKDDRVKVFHRTNYGIGATREFALQQAQGEYIMWVDSDDWIEHDMMESMYKKAIEADADIVGCGFVEHLPEKNVEHATFYKDKHSFLHDVISSQWGVLWKLLIRKDLIQKNDIHFPKGINAGEDYLFVTHCLLMADVVACEPGLFYHYNRCNSSSTISTPTIAKIMNQIEATELVEELLKDNNVLTLFRSELRMRKFIAKAGLKNISFWRWFFIYPEANIIWVKALLGKWKRKM